MPAKKDHLLRKAVLGHPPDAGPKAVSSPGEMRRHGMAALILLALIVAAYANSFGAGLALDNKIILLSDPRIRAATTANNHEIWWRGYWYGNQDPSLYRPLTTLSYLFNYTILGSGRAPAGYHWFNFLLHLVNALLVYRLGWVLFRRWGLAFAVAALWCVHPVLTESVTNIVGRADLLSAAGVLAGLLCHIEAGAAGGSRRIAWLAGLAAASAIGIFSKESSIVLIAAMLLYDLLFRDALWRSILPGYGAAAIPAMVFLALRAQVLSKLPANIVPFVSNPLVGASFWTARFTAIGVIGRYLLLLVWPYHLSADYSYNQIPVRGLADWRAVAALAACLAAAGAAALLWHRNRAAAFFILFFFLALAPVANIALLIGTIMAERLLYLPSIGFVACAAMAAAWIASKRPVLVPAMPWIAGLVCLALAARTHVRNEDWRSDLTLWSRDVAVAPAAYKPHMNLGAEYFRDASTLDRAIAEENRAMNILAGVAPSVRDELPYLNGGIMWRTKGDQLPAGSAQSDECYRKSLEVFLQGVEIDRAQTELVIRANRAAGKPPGTPGSPILYQELARTWLKLGQPGNATEALDHSLGIEPSPELFELLFEARKAAGDQSGAAVALMEGVLLFPEEKGFPSEIVKLYDETAPASCAVVRSGGGANLNIDCPLVHDRLCEAAVKIRDLASSRGQPAEAEKRRAMAVSLGCPAQ